MELSRNMQGAFDCVMHYSRPREIEKHDPRTIGEVESWMESFGRRFLAAAHNMLMEDQSISGEELHQTFIAEIGVDPHSITPNEDAVDFAKQFVHANKLHPIWTKVMGIRFEVMRLKHWMRKQARVSEKAL